MEKAEVQVQSIKYYRFDGIDLLKNEGILTLTTNITEVTENMKDDLNNINEALTKSGGGKKTQKRYKKETKKNQLPNHRNTIYKKRYKHTSRVR
jgi:hypothetical protein